MKLSFSVYGRKRANKTLNGEICSLLLAVPCSPAKSQPEAISTLHQPDMQIVFHNTCVIYTHSSYVNP